MIKTAKNIMEKAEESGPDPHLAMLIYRSTPIRPDELSPVELLTQRKYRLLLPIHQYPHPNLEKSREAQMAQKQTQADYYNEKDKQPQDLKQYQNVRVQLDPNKPVWQKATVIQQPTDGHPDVIKCRPNLERNISETVDACVLHSERPIRRANTTL